MAASRPDAALPVPAVTSNDSRRGRPRNGTQERRRAHLLETARGLFFARGFHEVPLADIARSARVALRTIYLRYGSKEGMLRALIRDEDERHAAELAQLGLAGKPWQVSLALLALHVAMRVRNPRVMRLREVVIGHGAPALVAAFDHAGPAKARAALAPVLAEAIGTARADGAHSIALLCGHFLACLAGTLPGPEYPPEPAATAARRAVDLFVRALAAAQAPENRLAFPLASNASTM
jgi:TetR/AcrR family transcriptional regulator, mexJK operon transcriptional repressor